MTDQGEDQVSWMETPAHAPVIASDGKEIGNVVEVAALTDEDIFHGVVFRHGRFDHPLLAPASDIARITTRAVYLNADSAAVERYEPFQEMNIERLGLRGVFRWKHFGWRKSQE